MEEETEEPIEEGTEESQEPLTEIQANEVLAKIKEVVKEGYPEVFLCEDKSCGKKIELHSRHLRVDYLAGLGKKVWSEFFSNNKHKGEGYIN